MYHILGINIQPWAQICFTPKARILATVLLTQYPINIVAQNAIPWDGNVIVFATDELKASSRLSMKMHCCWV